MKNVTKKSYPPAFKTRVALEMIKQEKTVSSICSEYGIHATQAHKWKRKAMETIQGGFQNPLKIDKQLKEKNEKIEELYKQVGKLTLELDWLKKKLGFNE